MPPRPQTACCTPTPSAVPAVVITGFLGSGKTTLVTHLLEAAGCAAARRAFRGWARRGAGGEREWGSGRGSCLAACCQPSEQLLTGLAAHRGKKLTRPYALITTTPNCDRG